MNEIMRIGMAINDILFFKLFDNNDNNNKKICCIDDTAVAVIVRCIGSIICSI